MRKKNYSLEKLVKDPSFVRWAEGTASFQEMEQWDRWINKSPKNRELARQAQQEVLGINFENSVRGNFSGDYKKLLDKIEKKGDRQERLNWTSKRKSNWYVRIAAVLLITAVTGVAAYFVMAGNNAGQKAEKVVWKQVQTTYAEQKTVEISDGSTIILNANSSLKYPEGWVGDSATVVHLQGEAYFSIADRKAPGAPPFKVKTEDGTVRVNGTKFVVAKIGQGDTRVVLEEGAVAITKNSSDNISRKDHYQLHPYEMAEFNRNGTDVSIQKVNNISVFTSWKDHKLVLDHTPFRYMIQRIKNTYGLQVKVKDKSLYNRTLTGTVKIREPEYLASAISEVMDVDVHLTNNTIVFQTKK